MNASFGQDSPGSTYPTTMGLMQILLSARSLQQKEQGSTKMPTVALAAVAQWIECWPVNQNGRWFEVPVRVCVWVAGQVTSWGACERQPFDVSFHTSMFFSLSFSLPSPISENKF